MGRLRRRRSYPNPREKTVWTTILATLATPQTGLRMSILGICTYHPE